MAKKDSKKQGKKDKSRTEASDVVDAVRGAVERTFQATAGGAQPAREAGRGLLDEVASAAQRIRESFDDLRVLEDVRGLRAEIEALSRRVAALEQQEKTAAKPAAAAASKPAAAVARKPAARKPAARKPAARKPAARKPAARKSAAASTASRTPRKSAAATSAGRKPAARRTSAAKPASGS